MPTEITLHTTSRVLQITFADGQSFRLPFEFLRVYSPSAEVCGHGAGQGTLQLGKRDVTIDQLHAVGHYAVQPMFSDGHRSGIYSWSYLQDLGLRQSALWVNYLKALAAAGWDPEAGRDANTADPTTATSGCGH